MWRCHNARHTLAAVALAAALLSLLGAGSARAQSAPPTSSETPDALESFAIPRPYADRLPNVVLKTHEGKSVRFYDDLLKDKIVLINFFYVTCSER